MLTALPLAHHYKPAFQKWLYETPDPRNISSPISDITLVEITDRGNDMYILGFDNDQDGDVETETEVKMRTLPRYLERLLVKDN